MKNNLFKSLALTGLLAITFAACKKDDKEIEPPVEQEIITTVKVTFTDLFEESKTFTYKIENGFNNTQPGDVSIDTINLLANSLYATEVRLYNEKVSPAEDITEEVIAESNEHLFLYSSNPATGEGSMTTSDGDTDKDGNPFNQRINITTDAAGHSSLTIHLMHQPTDKNGATPEAAGGETDVAVTFPVVVKEE